MTDNNVEGIVNEAVESQVDNSVEATETVEPTVEAVEEITEEATQEGVAEEQVSEEATEEKSQDGEWPKKAVNALANAKKQASKLREKNDAMARELETLKDMAKNQPKFEDKEPNEDEFDTYTDYIKSHSKWAAKSEISEANQEQVQQKIDTLESQHKEAYVHEREAYVESKAQEFKQQHSDFVEVLQANAEVPMTQDIEQAFLAVEDAPRAYYNLAKEGKLESLSRMPIAMAQAEIIQAQYRKPAAVQKTKPISAAPKPMKSATGTASSNRPLHQQSVEDTMKWFNK